MIKEFQKENRWLSNFWLVDVEFDGHIFMSVENAYQFAKAESDKDKQTMLSAYNPVDARRLGRRIKVREDWEDVKLIIMKSLVRQKFILNTDLRNKLISTGIEEIQEGNTWGDKFWGVDLHSGVGENRLGKIIMDIRKEIKDY